MRTHIDGCNCPHGVHVCPIPIEIVDAAIGSALSSMRWYRDDNRLTPRLALRHIAMLRWNREQFETARAK